MKKETSFLIVSIFWLLLLNTLVISFFIGKGAFAADILITGAVVAEPEDLSFVPGSILKAAIPLMVLNFIILALLIFVYERFVKER